MKKNIILSFVLLALSFSNSFASGQFNICDMVTGNWSGVVANPNPKQLIPISATGFHNSGTVQLVMGNVIYTGSCNLLGALVLVGTDSINLIGTISLGQKLTLHLYPYHGANKIHKELILFK